MSKPDKNELVFDRAPVGDVYPRYNISDLQRINEHIAYLSDHYGVLDLSPAWARDIVPAQADMQNMLDTVKRLRNAGIKLSTTPLVPSVIEYDFESANDVEQILYDLELLIDNVIECYKYSGTFVAGQEVVL